MKIETLKSIMGWVIMIIIIAILFSCNAEKKAMRQTHNALLKYPTVVAKIARDAFPCYVIKTTTTKDSTDFKLWKDSVDILNVFYTDLFNHIQPVLIHDTTNSCNAYKDNEVKYNKQIDIQSKLIAGLNYQIDNIKPIEDSIKNWWEDSAKINILQSVINSQDKTIVNLGKENTDLSETVKRKNKWILYLWLAVALSLVGIIIKLILKYK